MMIASVMAGCLGGDDDPEPEPEPVMGCMDATANNYDSTATEDDGSCTYDPVEVLGCMDSAATNYNAAATTDDGSCSYDTAYYMGKLADGSMSVADVQAALMDIRECKEDALSGVASACEIVAMTSDVDPPMMDPADAYDTSSGAVIENVYDTLYRYEPGADGTPQLVPRLATGHTVSDDGLTYTFTLRDGVFFSNGETFTADDVSYSWCRVLEYDSPDSGVAWIMYETLSSCDSFVVVDDLTFEVTLDVAYSAFIPTIAFWIGAVTDAGTCEANRVVTVDDAATPDVDESSDDHCNAYLHANPLGTNAYVLNSYIEETELVLTPNWLYWEEGNFNLNKITRSEVAEEATRVAALKDGEVDFASVPTGNLADVCLNADNPAAITGDPAQGTDCGPENSLSVALGIMNTNPTIEGTDGDVAHNQFMADGEVRKALSYIYDYDTAISDVYDGFGIPLHGPIPLGMPFVETQHATFSYDLDMARSILDTAGYTCDDHDSDADTPCQRFNGEAIRLFFNDGNVNREANANLMAQNLDLVGIANTVTGEPWGNMLDRMFGTANWDFMFLGWAPDYNDPDNYWFPFVASASEHGDVYNTQYSNTDIDALLIAAKTETDYDARAALYEQAHDLYMDEPSLIFMSQSLSYHVHSDRVTMPMEVPPATIPWFNVDKA
jgi:peptide/nickel transport system substrate-binding protein